MDGIWHKADEAKPEPYQPVLVHWADKIELRIGWWHKARDIWVDGWAADGRMPDPSHWMYLPKPPREDAR